MDLLKEKIKAEAIRLGFSFIGFSKPQQTPHYSRYKAWLSESVPDDLGYLNKKYVVDARIQPMLLLENAGTVITIGVAYPKFTSLGEVKKSERKIEGQIAAYACLPDYHTYLKGKSKELIAFIKAEGYISIKTRFFVDSGPVMEKDFAYNSGLGWIGKNSLFISPAYGSFCLLGCLFIDKELSPDLPDENDLCGECDLCIKACPTSAITNNRTINANRCISFLTTAYKGVIPDNLQRLIGNNIFGCDICQNVCPLNRKVANFEHSSGSSLKPVIENKVELVSELAISENQYIKKYSNTPIVKLPYELFLRNIINAIGNSGTLELIEPLLKILRGHTSPLIRSTVAWAIASLDLQKSKPILLGALNQEAETEVRREIESALQLSR